VESKECADDDYDDGENLAIDPFLCFIQMEDTLIGAAVNNYAVCTLHLKQIKKSVERLEALIQLDPSRFMVDPVVFNLCTLYDFVCTPEMSICKKQVLQKVAAIYNIDEPVLNYKSYRL